MHTSQAPRPVVERAEDVPRLVVDDGKQLVVTGGIVQQHEGVAFADAPRQAPRSIRNG